MIKRLTNRGDTLIEVLLAIAILSAIIGVIYGIANRAQRSSQLTQQRAEATAIAQTQVERLRAIRDSNMFTPDNFPSFFTPNFPPYFSGQTNFTGIANAFCIPASPTSANISDQSVLQDAHIAAHHCKAAGRYDVAIEFDSTTRTFKTIVAWNFNGMMYRQYVIMDYRLW